MSVKTTTRGLGDDAVPDVVVVREEYPLPGTRKEIVDLIFSVLSGGGVQRLIVALKEPMQVFRAVPKGDARVPQEIPPDELLLAARYAEMHEFNFAQELPAHEHLFRAFAWMTARRLKPRALLVSSTKELRRWLEVDDLFDLTEVFGLEVKEDPEVPEDTALFLGIVPGIQDRVSASLRLSMNLPPQSRA